MKSDIIFAGIILSLFLIAIIKAKGKGHTSDNYLVLWFGVTALHLFFLYDNLSESPIIPKTFQASLFLLPLLGSPVFYLYAKHLAFGDKTRLQEAFLHSSPYVFFCISISAYCLFNSNSGFSFGIPHFTGRYAAFFEYLATIPLAVFPAFYIVLILRLLYKYKKFLPENYSYTEKISLQWLQIIVYSETVLFFILFIIIKFGHSIISIDFNKLFFIVGDVMSMYVLVIGYYSFRQTFLSESIKLTWTETASYKKTGIDEKKAKELFAKLEKHIIEKKSYLNENLTLSSLASEIELSANNLSQVINQVSHESFFNYINKYRIEEAKQMLKNPEMNKFTILAIAYEAGFRSKSSFNKLFKQTTGKTPSEYKTGQAAITKF